MSSISSLTQTTQTSVSGTLPSIYSLLSGEIMEHAPLEAVFIYFDTATYDEIERDEKVKFIAFVVSNFK